MLVRCPTCQKAYRLDPGRMPPTGLRVRCPGCTTVFRVRTAGKEEGSTAPPVAPTPKPAAPAAPLGPGLSGLQRDLRQPPRSVRRPSLPTQRPQRASPEGPPPPVATPRAWHSERTLDLNQAQSTAQRAQLETTPFLPGKTAPPPGAPAPPPARPQGPADVAPSPAPAPQRATPAAPTHLPATSLEPDVAVRTATRSEDAIDRDAEDAATRARERARRLARALVSDILVYNQEQRDRALAEGNLASALGAEVNKAWELYKAKVEPQVLRTTDYFREALNEILAAGQQMF